LADFVLVHVAWGGGWSFDRLAQDLWTAGHRVVVAELAGLGKRRADLHPGITLTDHVDDVCAQVEAAGFARFVLVGHSYGGMVITGVATRLGGRIDAMVWLDAFLPADGQSLWDITGDYEHRHYIDSQKFTPGLVAPIMGKLDDRHGRHPLLTLTEPVHFTGEEAKIPRHVYVYATGYNPTPFTRFRNQVIGQGNWELHEVGGGHDVMADEPERLLQIVLGLCASSFTAPCWTAVTTPSLKRSTPCWSRLARPRCAVRSMPSPMRWAGFPRCSRATGWYTARSMPRGPDSARPILPVWTGMRISIRQTPPPRFISGRNWN